MRESGSNTPKRMSDRERSTNSSRLRIFQSSRMRRGLPRGTTSAIQQRRYIRVVEDGLDLTPKSLSHAYYPAIDEKQLTAFDAIGISRSESASQIANISSTGHHVAPRSSSFSFVGSSSIHTNAPFDETIENFISTQGGITSSQSHEIDRAPSQFCLPRYDSSIFHEKLEKVTIIIKETETFFLFEMPQLTEDVETPEGLAVREANERYEYITVGEGSNRKLVNAETQTPRINTKSRSTYIARRKRENRGTFVNNWVMHDTYATPKFTKDQDDCQIANLGSTSEFMRSEPLRHKFSKNESSENGSIDDELVRIYGKTSFRDAVRVMERIIASNLCLKVQKRFKGLMRKNRCDLDLELTYSLDLLWTHSCPLTNGREVSCFRWNPVNVNLLAAGYGASTTENNGFLLIWCTKNINEPERIYKFDSPISDAAWSVNKPNQLAIGFYDGTIKVIDVSKKDLNVVKRSSRNTSPSYSPHWQIQWWPEDEQFDYQEQIYTSNQDGRIVRYQTGEDFAASEIMRVPRIEGKVAGVKRTNYCNAYDIPISRHPGALLLRRHPTLKTVYFVGTDEGCLSRCSTNYLHQHSESFLVHDGPVYSLEFSPFCSKIFLTCGADWCTRIWADGITEPLITLSTQMACVRGSTWCPTNSTVIASIVDNEICIWDIKRKIYRPVSITLSSNSQSFLMLQFTNNGDQLVVADSQGIIYIYSLEGMPFPPFDQTSLLVKSIEKTLVTNRGLLKKLKKLGSPF